ncbi:MAG: HesA/MoeB/ThiF family protein [Bacilli bacterium]|nr:HesA/MoeB/ThiF family protein [Bacilli bacterium]
MEKLSQEQLARYQYTIGLEEIKEEGQLKLLNSSVLVVGTGGLGSAALLALACLGIGHIGIVDNDVISATNLPRQIIYGFKDVGKGKAITAKKVLKNKNPNIDVKIYPYRLDEKNARRIIKKYDIVLDCTDNFESKFLINDTCVKLKIPFVCAGVMDYKGQIMTYIPGSKDFKSLFDELPKYDPNDDKSVYPLAVSIISNIAASEVVKCILNLGELLTNSLLVIDTLKTSFKKYEIK